MVQKLIGGTNTQIKKKDDFMNLLSSPRKKSRLKHITKQNPITNYSFFRSSMYLVLVPYETPEDLRVDK
jgi:hypothetical protein